MMLRVKAIPGEPTRFWVESWTLECPQCSAKFNRRTRHRLLARYEDVPHSGYLYIGDPCPKCGGELDCRFHVVDIANYNGVGECGCEYHQMKLGPELRKLSLAQRGGSGDKYRCSHVKAARDFALDVALAAHDFERHRRADGQREEAAA